MWCTSGLFVTIVFVVCSRLASAEVILLNDENFEHLTQASTGATTGDWLVKFYAPWCGHCKNMEGLYAEVADILDGEINVAKVDVTANRDLGKRFDIKGFPTIKFISRGQVYNFEGRRTAPELVEFARGGYQIQSPAKVEPPGRGLWGDLKLIFKHAYKTAATDLKEGRYFTIDILLVFLPVLFFILVVVVLFAPLPQPPKVAAKQRSAKSEQHKSSTAHSAPPTSETEATISGKPSDKKLD